MTTTISGNSWEAAASSGDLSTGGVSPSTDENVPVPRERWRCSIAATRAERERAFRLIYDAYVRSGLGTPNAWQMRVTPYHLLPTTTIFNATLTDGPEEGEVFSTVSLVIDGAFGLPMESIYADEVAERRERGLLIGEVSCLADRRSDPRRFFQVFCALNRWMIQFARAQRLDQVLVVVHPKHARFYTRNLGFEAIGPVANYPTVCNRPAVPLCFDFAKNDRQPFPYYDRFFGEPIPAHALQPAAMSPTEIEFFGRMVDPTLTGKIAATSGVLAP